MTDQIILTIPENISDIARSLAQQSSKPAEQVLLEYLETLVLPALPLTNRQNSMHFNI